MRRTVSGQLTWLGPDLSPKWPKLHVVNLDTGPQGVHHDMSDAE